MGIFTYAYKTHEPAYYTDEVCTIKCEGKVHPYTGTEVLYKPYGHTRSSVLALLFHDSGTRKE
jgi:hypothetical protein